MLYIFVKIVNVELHDSNIIIAGKLFRGYRIVCKSSSGGDERKWLRESHLDSSSKQWWICANWPIIGPNRRIMHYITCSLIWPYMPVHLSVVI